MLTDCGKALRGRTVWGLSSSLRANLGAQNIQSVRSYRDSIRRAIEGISPFGIVLSSYSYNSIISSKSNMSIAPLVTFKAGTCELDVRSFNLIQPGFALHFSAHESLCGETRLKSILVFSNSA